MSSTKAKTTSSRPWEIARDQASRWDGDDTRAEVSPENSIMANAVYLNVRFRAITFDTRSVVSL